MGVITGSLIGYSHFRSQNACEVEFVPKCMREKIGSYTIKIK